jgi:hypothetical protein
LASYSTPSTITFTVFPVKLCFSSSIGVITTSPKAYCTFQYELPTCSVVSVVILLALPNTQALPYTLASPDTLALPKTQALPYTLASPDTLALPNTQALPYTLASPDTLALPKTQA